MASSGGHALSDLVESGFRRPLSPSEIGFGAVCDAVEYAVLGRGALDLAALERAFVRVRREYPVLAGAVRTDERGAPELWFPGPGLPSFAVSEGDVAEAVGYEPSDGASALRVVRRGERFRVSLVVCHEIADGRAALEYFEALWAGYAAFASGEAPPEAEPKPLPLPAEAFLAREGIGPPPGTCSASSSPAQAAGLRGTGSSDSGPSDSGSSDSGSSDSGSSDSGSSDSGPSEAGVGRLRFRLSREETGRLLALGKARGVSAHGVVCAALVLAEAERGAHGSEFPARVVSLVDLRPRLERDLVRGADGTVLVGFATSVVHVAEAGDPMRWGEQILADLREQLRAKEVHRSVFHPLRTSWSSDGPDCEVSVTNWGVVPALPPVDGLEVEDFHGSFLGKVLGGQSLRGVARPGSWVVRSFDGRLGVELCFVSPRPRAEIERWDGAIRRAFGRLLAAAP